MPIFFLPPRRGAHHVPTAWMLAATVFTFLCTTARSADVQPSALEQWNDALNNQLVDYYESPEDSAAARPVDPAPVVAGWTAAAKALVNAPAGADPFPFAAGGMRGRMQQATVLEMAHAIREGHVEAAKALRAELVLPRGVSANEGALVLQTLGKHKQEDAIRLLVREAVSWQTTRVRQLLDEAVRSTTHEQPMPGRLMEQLGEALALADLPPSLRQEAGLTDSEIAAPSTDRQERLAEIRRVAWAEVMRPTDQLRAEVEGRLPSLLTPTERERRERLLLKLVQLIPKEYSAGVRDGQVAVALEYHEAVTFNQQARQIAAELAPLWLATSSQERHDAVQAVEAALEQADQKIAQKASPEDLNATLNEVARVLQGNLGITLRRAGTTADIVEEVMLETRTLLSQSLSAALAGQWNEAERLRVEAYTTYDPELEARLLPRDPQLAKDIERLLLDGVDEPGVKVMLDRHASSEELQAAYERVRVGLEQATTILKSEISPVAAVMSASSIVLREGLEGLLVIVAILAGLRGSENAHRRRLFWIGIAGSVAATAVTWILSQYVITSLRSYGEIIEAVTGVLAIIVLLLITNWLFHQVYWRQWVTTLKAQAQGESTWQLMSVGFLVGYREGFETVLFLQSLVMDAGGRSVGLGVAIGCVSLFALGLAALRLGIKLPYFQILMATALLIGLVLITFVGSTVRSAQTIGWLPVHRLTSGSWPAWAGNWLGLHNTVESLAVQLATILLVIGTWRVARWQAQRKAARRRQMSPCAVAREDGITPCGRPVEACQEAKDAPAVSEPVQIRIVQVEVRQASV